MRTLRIALLALVSLSALDASSAFARGNGGAAGGGAGAGAGGGASGGGSSGGAGAGSTPLAYSVIPQREGHRPRPVFIPGKQFSSCFKQEHLYDSNGFAVVNLHGAECFQ